MRMRRFLPDRVTSLSFLSGLVLACSFPRPDLASVAWIALVPVFVLMYERPFRSGFAAGVGFFGLVLYWLNIVMTTYGKMHPVFSVVAYLLLVGYLALFFAVATWAACRLRERLGLSPLLTLPVLWVALEFLRSFLLSGFPWASLGYSQQSHLVLIQSVDLFGVYGLSFLIVLVNVVLAGTVRALAKSSRSALPWKSAITAALLLAVNSGYGYFRLAQDLNSRERTLIPPISKKPWRFIATFLSPRWEGSRRICSSGPRAPLPSTSRMPVRSAMSWWLPPVRPIPGFFSAAPPTNTSIAAPNTSIAPFCSLVRERCSDAATRSIWSPLENMFPWGNISLLSINSSWESEIFLPGLSALCR